MVPEAMLALDYASVQAFLAYVIGVNLRFIFTGADAVQNCRVEWAVFTGAATAVAGDLHRDNPPFD